jgi:hypothetical protein
MTAPGATVQILAGDSGDGQDPAKWPPVSNAVASAPVSNTFALAKPATARYVVVWITNLPPHNGGFGVGVSDIKVFGATAG